jgi:hypothetical protein
MNIPEFKLNQPVTLLEVPTKQEQHAASRAIQKQLQDNDFSLQKQITALKSEVKTLSMLLEPLLVDYDRRMGKE